jgi:hypothetical protein
MLFSSLPKDLALQAERRRWPRRTLLTWIAMTCATENVPHRQRLREIRKVWPGIRVAGVYPRSGEEIARRAARMNSSSSGYVLSCIGRWVAYSILRWNLSAIGYSLRKTLRDLAGAPEAASPNFQPRCSY